MISDVLALVDFVNRLADQAAIKVAYFDGDGTKISGDPDVNVDVISTNVSTTWYFKVQTVAGYEFLRYPIHPEGVIEQNGKLTDQTYDASIFRYIPAGRMSATGFANVRTPFVIHGYPVSVLLRSGSPVGS